MQRIGLLGGTFDPVHNGHLQLGEKVLARYRLDKIVFIPAAHPPHKNGAVVGDVEHVDDLIQVGSDSRTRDGQIEVKQRTGDDILQARPVHREHFDDRLAVGC